MRRIPAELQFVMFPLPAPHLLPGGHVARQRLRKEVLDTVFGPQPQRRIGRYRLVEIHGAGAMGLVYRAHDEELDRTVALKLMSEDAEGTAPRSSCTRGPRIQRLRREAQAMARLVHPHVVPVYDVGLADEVPYIVMEYVEGPTLDAWLTERPRTVSEVVRIFVQAAKALAAAHTAGIIHRDFKPSNVLIDRRGDARITDFGLARGQSSLPTRHTSRIPIDAPLSSFTLSGGPMGTPLYMAPEQHAGANVGPAADQFSFCVALLEALSGRYPFAHSDYASLVKAKRAGRLPPLRDAGLPAHIYRALCRGLAPRPDDRWSSMEALLGELRRGSRRRAIGWMLGITALGVTVLGGATWPVGENHRCRSHERLDGIWDEPRRAQVREAILATHRAHASATWDRVGPALDVYAERWLASYRSTCADATDARALDGRMLCLAARRSELRALVDMLIEADATVLDNAVVAVAGLPSIEACDDAPAPATDPEVAQQREILQRARTLGSAGKPAHGLRLAMGVQARAGELGDETLVAEANLRVAQLQAPSVPAQDSVESYRTAYFTARRAEADDIAVQAATALVEVLTKSLGRHDEAQQWAEHARADLERVHDPTAAIRLDMAEGLLATERGDYDRALAFHRDALAAAQAIEDAGSLVAETLNNIGAVQYWRGEYDDARVHLTAAIEQTEARLGPDHPLVATMMVNVGAVYEALGDDEAAMEHLERALAIKEAALGPTHGDLTSVLANVCGAGYRAGRYEEALRYCRRGLALWPDVASAPAAQMAALLNNTGLLLSAAGDDTAALEHHERALVVLEGAYGPDHPEVAFTLALIGSLLVLTGEHEHAIDLLTRAMAGIDATVGPDHRRAAEVRDALARARAATDGADRAGPRPEAP